VPAAVPDVVFEALREGGDGVADGALGDVPMLAVGQATMAMRARRSPSASSGCAATYDMPWRGERAKVAGAIWRQASQSMQLSSTKKAPGTFSGRRWATRATDTV